jgi:hypothetical protein
MYGLENGFGKGSLEQTDKTKTFLKRKSCDSKPWQVLVGKMAPEKGF